MSQGLARLHPETSRTDSVLAELTRAIIDGRLVPGSLHSAQSLAVELGVSRTPVREALLQLASAGVVRFERNRGVRIVKSSAQDLADLYEMREWLEVPAAAKAALERTEAQLGELRLTFEAMAEAAERHDLDTQVRQDRRFHWLFLEASGNSRVAPYVDSLRETLLRRDALTILHGRDHRQILEDHRVILEAIVAGDSEAAAQAVRAHLRQTIALLLDRERSVQ